MRWKQFFTPTNHLNPEEARQFMAERNEGEYTLLDVRQPESTSVSGFPVDFWFPYLN